MSELNDGPCLAAVRRQRTVRVDDLDADQRWPTFAAHAAIAVAGAQGATNLAAAVETRGTIGTAIGILMER